MSAKHKDDLIEFSCSICNKSNPRLKDIAIHYVLCPKGLTGRGSRNGAGKRGESEPMTVNEVRVINVSREITRPNHSGRNRPACDYRGAP